MGSKTILWPPSTARHFNSSASTKRHTSKSTYKPTLRRRSTSRSAPSVRLLHTDDSNRVICTYLIRCRRAPKPRHVRPMFPVLAGIRGRKSTTCSMVADRLPIHRSPVSSLSSCPLYPCRSSLCALGASAEVRTEISPPPVTREPLNHFLVRFSVQFSIRGLRFARKSRPRSWLIVRVQRSRSCVEITHDLVLCFMSNARRVERISRSILSRLVRSCYRPMRVAEQCYVGKISFRSLQNANVRSSYVLRLWRKSTLKYSSTVIFLLWGQLKR